MSSNYAIGAYVVLTRGWFGWRIGDIGQVTANSMLGSVSLRLTGTRVQYNGSVSLRAVQLATDADITAFELSEEPDESN